MKESLLGKIKRSVQEVLNRERVTREEQIAFLKVANRLIFTKPFRKLISPENVLEISEMIQENFRDFEKQLKQKAEAMLQRAEIAASVSITEKVLREEFEERIDSISTDHIMMGEPIQIDPEAWEQREVLNLSATEFISEWGVAISEYSGIGFTPKLAVYESDHMSLNCLGRAIEKGKILKERGFAPYMLVGVDHPEPVLLKDGKIFLNPDTEIHSVGQIEKKDGYMIVRRTQLRKDDFETKLNFIFPFDQAVLYEILDNLEIYRRVSLGEHVYLLPGTHEKIKAIAKKYRKTLQATNWGTLQEKLFPEIVKAFEENKKEYSDARKKVRFERIIDLATEALNEAFAKGRMKTSFAALDKKEADDKIFEESEKYPKEILNFLVHHVKFPENVNSDVKIFYEEVKKVY